MLLNSYLDLCRSGEPGAVVVWSRVLILFELVPVSACLLPEAPSLVDWFVDLFKELILGYENSFPKQSLSHSIEFRTVNLSRVLFEIDDYRSRCYN